MVVSIDQLCNKPGAILQRYLLLLLRQTICICLMHVLLSCFCCCICLKAVVLCICQVKQFLAGDSNRQMLLGEADFWALQCLQQIASGPTSPAFQLLSDVVEDALSLACSLT